jgi:hypothetical protein
MPVPNSGPLGRGLPSEPHRRRFSGVALPEGFDGMEICHLGSRFQTADATAKRSIEMLVESGKSWVFISASLKRPSKTTRDRLSYLQRQGKNQFR